MKLLPLLLLLQFFTQFTAFAAVDINTTANIVHHDSSNGSSPSRWIKEVMNQEWPSRTRGCRHRPWICNPPGERGRKIRKKCCHHKCINVYSDVNHCGYCKRRCPFGWSCCAGKCVDTRFNRRNCGSCFNRCPRHVSCFLGMCGYADGVLADTKVQQPLRDQVTGQADAD
ncbi:hypothetical protein QQ045_018308 [Rhodiola kirilowii]